ncbi:MAG TPA: crosslink repair DNA glycosylase YcaQ family protein [Gaiellaceae bacterium]
MHAQALDGTATGVLSTVRRLRFLQMDPIASVATPQEMVLWSRLGAYDRAELDRLLWKTKQLIEWNAYIWPTEDLPMLRARMRNMRRKGTTQSKGVNRWLDQEQPFRRYVLRELDKRGPLLSREIEPHKGQRRERHNWWGERQIGLMLECLTLRGEVAVAGRSGKQRVWDLADRVWPAGETLPIKDGEKLHQEKRFRALGAVLERGKWRVHPEADDSPVPNRITLLSPFDQLVHNRDRAEALWGFYYRLEMYVPQAKRQYGYYVLPILRGDKIVGRIEPVLDRKAGVLRVKGTWWEDGVKPVSLKKPLQELARFLGAKLESS